MDGIQSDRVTTVGSGIDSPTVIADAMRAKFGVDALAVAEKQLKFAEEETWAVWTRVVTELQAGN